MPPGSRNGPRSATVKTLTPVVLLNLPIGRYAPRLVDETDPAVAPMRALLAALLRRMNRSRDAERPAGYAATIAPRARVEIATAQRLLRRGRHDAGGGPGSMARRSRSHHY